VLGLGAAAIMPLALAIIPVLFAPEERQKATAVMASTIFLSFPIRPLVGGVLLDCLPAPAGPGRRRGRAGTGPRRER
jgi:MFS family permease